MVAEWPVDELDEQPARACVGVLVRARLREHTEGCGGVGEGGTQRAIHRPHGGGGKVAAHLAEHREGWREGWVGGWGGGDGVGGGWGGLARGRGGRVPTRKDPLYVKLRLY